MFNNNNNFQWVELDMVDPKSQLAIIQPAVPLEHGRR
jgi:hypothetical protein